ncbi:zona pellucida sperm-binding protein 4-like [Bombina bombina]|uniref:zona pellucida sperm-binding protein 4-like n=1 Tax=Bombina bombina TaxID=8345 RepID=UPI00235AB841|nr:zona pellucida sperm-binding protein 4-like [Bombina bombina]
MTTRKLRTRLQEHLRNIKNPASDFQKHKNITSVAHHFLKYHQNKNGTSHDFSNSSACGTWVEEKSDGSLVFSASYDGCYVSKEDGEYLMTVIEETLQNGNAQQNKRELRCPIIAVMDAPSPDVCSAIQLGDRVSCATAPVSRELCEGLGCCFTPLDATMPCYFGSKVTAQCTAENQLVVAISKDVTVPSLILNSVNVLSVDPATCSGMRISRNNLFVVFQFPLSCGSSHMVDDRNMIYENTFEATRDVRNWQGASITRDSTMKLTVRCSYSRTSVIPLQVEVVTLPPPPPVSTTGPLSLEMRIAQDESFSRYYVDGDYPVVKVLREPVYLEVRILRKADPNLVLLLNECWATPSTNANEQPQWPVLERSCPFTGDNYRTQLIPVGAESQTIPYPTHYQRFSISTFTFVDEITQLPLGGLVYFHCSASVCVPSTSDSCRRTCSLRKKRAPEKLSMDKTLTTIVTSEGPVDFISATMAKAITKGALDSGYTALVWARGSAVAGVIIAVIIAVKIWKCRGKHSIKIFTLKA